MTTEKQLIDRLKRGDPKAMEPLMELHQDYVYTLIIQMIKSSSAAEELTQDVFVKVFQKIDTYQERSKFSTWLYTVAYRTCLNYLDKKKIVFNLSELGEDQVHNYNEDQNLSNLAVDLSFKEDEQQNILWAAIDGLPMQQGLVITLHYLQQFTVKEISTMLHLPENTVKTHLFRGRNALKTILLNKYSEEELL